MPGGKNGVASKRSHPDGSTFPSDLKIPKTAQQDRKFRTSYVRIFNDPRVYKRQRFGDRTSSRFDTDYDCHINVVFNEPAVKRKSILLNAENSKEKQSHNDSGTRKSVSFSSKITVIDTIDLDGGSSNGSDDEFDENEKKRKIKLKKMEEKVKVKSVKNDTTIGTPSPKNHGNKIKNKSPSKNGHKSKSSPKSKELFKFKITKPFRKIGRSEKKLKSLQKKFGSRMFKSFVRVRRGFKNLSDQLLVPLSENTNNKVDLNTNELSVVEIDNKMTKKLRVVLTPLKLVSSDTNEVKVDKVQMIKNDDSVEQNQTIEVVHDTIISESTRSESTRSESTRSESTSEVNDIQIDSQIDVNGTNENMNGENEIKENQSIMESPSAECINPVPAIKINGESVKNISNGNSTMTLQPYNKSKPSPKITTSNSSPNIFDKITCNMFYNTNEDETATTNGQLLNSDKDIDLVDNISSLNVSFSMPSNSLADDILGCDASELASIHLNILND